MIIQRPEEEPVFTPVAGTRPGWGGCELVALVPLIEQVKNRLPVMTRSQRKVARFLLSDPEFVVFASADRIGQVAGVSQATVIRTCQVLGYRGYGEFQEYVRHLIREGRTLERYRGAVESGGKGSPAVDIFRQVLAQDIENLRKTMESISGVDVERAVSLLATKKRIYITGARASHATAYFLAYNLATLVPHARLLEFGVHFFHQLRYFDENTALVVIGFPRYTDTTLRILRYAKSRRCATVAITDSPVSPLARMADVTLTAEIRTPAATDSHTAAMSVATALLTGVALQRGEDAANNAARFESALAEWNAEVKIDETDLGPH